MFVLEVSDMLGLRTNMFSHAFPINLGFSLVKKKASKFNLELRLIIRQAITKQVRQLVDVTQ